MVKDAHQEGQQEGQEQRLVGNGLLQVTVTALIFREWHVDETSPSRSRWFFLDGLAAGAFGAIYYIRAWFEIPLDDLSRSEELDQIPMNSFLKLSSCNCTLESSEGFHFDEELPKGSPQIAIGLKEPEYSLVGLEDLEDSLSPSCLRPRRLMSQMMRCMTMAKTLGAIHFYAAIIAKLSDILWKSSRTRNLINRL